MESYKIRVNNEAESKEAQELFFELGYEWKYKNIGKNYYADSSIGFLYADHGCITTGDNDYGYDFFKYRSEGNKLVTFPQLRDLVVLKRNNFTDATHTDQDGWKWFISSDNKSYVFGAGNSQGLPRWDESSLDHVDLKPIQTAQAVLNNLDELREEYKDYHKDPALISGAEAKLAWANGKDVEYQNKVDLEGIWFDLTESNLLGIFTNDRFIFRIKPQTIKLELELPKPFEPKVGEWFYYLSAEHEDGYGSRIMHDDTPEYLMNLGAYRTEDEIKQVVEQLRKIKGAV